MRRLFRRARCEGDAPGAHDGRPSGSRDSADLALDEHIVHNDYTGYLRDSSSIVKTFAMQALVDLTTQAPEFRPAVLRQLQKLTVRGTPAMRARGRKLIEELSDSTGRPARGAKGRRAG